MIFMLTISFVALIIPKTKNIEDNHNLLKVLKPGVIIATATNLLE